MIITMNIETGAPEQSADFAAAERPAKQIEIINNDETDVIINHDSPEALWAYKLADIWKHGQPDDWRPFNPSKGHVTLGEVDGQRFVAKRRIYTAKNENDTARIAEKFDRGEKREELAVNSLVSEIRLAPKIREAVSGDELKDILHYGYSLPGITYVEPIMGVIDRANADDPRYADKIMIYPYIPDTMALDTEEGLSAAGLYKYPVEVVVDELTEQLKNNGVRSNDLHPVQLLVDPDKNLYLIDTEAYAAE